MYLYIKHSFLMPGHILLLKIKTCVCTYSSIAPISSTLYGSIACSIDMLNIVYEFKQCVLLLDTMGTVHCW